MKSKNLAQNGILVLAVLGSLVLLNLLGLRAFGRLDVTHDKTYTLSEASKETLKNLDDSVTVTAYFTESLPAPYSSNARYVRDLLEEFRSASKGKLSFEFIDPAEQESAKDKETKRETKRDIFGRSFREQTSVEKELATVGVQPVEIRVVEADQQQTKRAYMGLVLRHGEKKEVIPVVQSVANLEYDLTSLIRKMTRTKTPVIGLLQGDDEPNPQEKLQHLYSVLSQTYELKPVTLGAQKRFDASIDALFVIGPKKELPLATQKAIDQFLMEGKSVAFLLDSISIDMKSFEHQPVSSGLTPMLADYGVTVGTDLIADANSASLNASERRGYMVVNMPLPYPYIPVVKRLEGDSPLTKGITDLAFPFVTQVSAAPAEGRQVQVLARTSAKSWTEGASANLDPRRDWRSETITPTGSFPVMVSVQGKLKSHFASEANTSAPPGEPPVLAESKADSRLIVVGTGAIFQDDFMNSRANAALLLNTADWLLLDPAMLAMRTRGLSLAPLKPELPDGVRNGVKFGNALGLPLLLAAFGLVRWRMRESRRRTVTP